MNRNYIFECSCGKNIDYSSSINCWLSSWFVDLEHLQCKYICCIVDDNTFTVAYRFDEGILFCPIDKINIKKYFFDFNIKSFYPSSTSYHILNETKEGIINQMKKHVDNLIFE